MHQAHYPLFDFNTIGLEEKNEWSPCVLTLLFPCCFSTAAVIVNIHVTVGTSQISGSTVCQSLEEAPCPSRPQGHLPPKSGDFSYYRLMLFVIIDEANHFSKHILLTVNLMNTRILGFLYEWHLPPKFVLCWARLDKPL